MIFFRGEGEDRDGTELGKVVAFQLPGGMGFRQLPGGKAPFFFHRGAGGHAFQAAAVIGTDALRQRIARQGTDPDVSDFRMQKAVDRLAVDDQTAADTGADGDIEAAFKAFGRTEDGFGQGRGVHIGIHGDGDLQGLREFRDNGVIAPGQLGRCRDGAESRGGWVQIQGAEAADAQGGNGMLPEKGDHFGHGFLRRFRREFGPFEEIALFIQHGQNHFCSAGFKRSVAFHDLSVPFCFIAVLSYYTHGGQKTREERDGKKLIVKTSSGKFIKPIDIVGE